MGPGVWLLIIAFSLFRYRRPIRQFFAPEISKPRQRPLGITLIAWWYIIGPVTLILVLILGLQQHRIPVTQPFGGSRALVVLLVLSALSLTLGIGLLRGRYWGWLAAVSYQVFVCIVDSVRVGFLNSQEMGKRYKEFPRNVLSFHQAQMLAVGIVAGGGLISFLLLWLLMRYRPFFRAQRLASPDKNEME